LVYKSAKTKFFAIKYTRRYSYSKFGTFLAPPSIALQWERYLVPENVFLVQNRNSLLSIEYDRVTPVNCYKKLQHFHVNNASLINDKTTIYRTLLKVDKRRCIVIWHVLCSPPQ